jgi:hypothetical protein
MQRNSLTHSLRQRSMRQNSNLNFCIAATRRQQGWRMAARV